MLKTISLAFIFLLNMNSCNSDFSNNKESLNKPTNSQESSLQVSIEKNVEKDVLQQPDQRGTQIDWNNSARIGCVSMPETNKIWVVINQDGRLRFTEDSGETWRILNFGAVVECVDFFDKENGWIIDAKYNLWITSDGGKNWNGKPMNVDVASIQKIKMRNHSSGWIVSGNKLLFTNDSGNSWQTSFSGKTNNCNLSDLSLVDNKNGWLCETDEKGGKVYQKSDSSNDWILKQTFNNKISRWCNVFFTNQNEGWYSNSNTWFGDIFSTTDGGNNWKKVENLPKNFVANSMHWLNANEGFLVGDSKIGELKRKGVVLKTDDNGKSFNEIELNNNEIFFTEIDFVNSQKGFLVSKDNLYITLDSGREWKKVYSLPNWKN